MSADIASLDRIEFRNKVIEAPGPVVVEFRAEWCEFCKEFETALQELAEEFEQVQVYTVDIVDRDRLANDFAIAEVPTFTGFVEGNLLKRVERPDSTDDIRAIFDYLLGLEDVA